MYKAVFCLQRKDGMDEESFRTYWSTDHATLANRLPGLRKYTVTFADDPDKGYEGTASLWFDDRAALDAALNSSEAETLMADLPNFSKPGEMLSLFGEERDVFAPNAA
ncbi:MAG: EthD family reductase [Halobacteriales archaeon]|nr:EthD family reductase [Halobacteriales archaeon]